jgi:hypothetical protein
MYQHVQYSSLCYFGSFRMGSKDTLYCRETVYGDRAWNGNCTLMIRCQRPGCRKTGDGYRK